MTATISLSCACGAVRLEVRGTPIISAECCCKSCREAGARLGALPGARPFTEPNGNTRMVLYRKDRVRFTSGAEHLREFRLTAQSPTRRVVAACCNSPLFLEFQNGHWLSLYASAWPAHSPAPRPDLATMTADLPAGAAPPPGIPSGRGPTAAFYARLLAAWIAMRFRSPQLRFISGEIHA